MQRGTAAWAAMSAKAFMLKVVILSKLMMIYGRNIETTTRLLPDKHVFWWRYMLAAA